MKASNWLLMGALAVGLTACSSESVVDEATTSDATTYAGLVISMQQAATRADGVTQGQYSNPGRTAECSVSNIILLSSLGGNHWDTGYASKPGTPTSDAFWKDDNGNYTVGAYKASSGNQLMALALNGEGLNGSADLLSNTFGSAATAISDISKLSTDDKFVMTSKRVENNVLDNILEETVNGQATVDATKNVFGFDVERVVSQAIVWKGSSLSSLTTDLDPSQVYVDLNSLTYAVVNGATTVNTFLDKAGERSISEVTSGVYKYNGFESAIHDYLGASTDDWKNAQTQHATTGHLIRLGNYSPVQQADLNGATTAAARATLRNTKNDALGGYKAVPVLDNSAVTLDNTTTPVSSQRGIYFLENSVKQVAITAENKAYGFYRLAYAKVYGTVKPVTIYGVEWVADGGTIKEGTDVVQYAIKTQAEYEAMPESSNADKIAKKHVYVEGTTFYRGVNDDILYANPLGAMIGKNLHNTWADDTEKLTNAQPYWTYLDARCAWRALLNRQTGTDTADDITKAVMNGNTRRNNIYVLEIASFQQIGMPFDSSDPQDPNLPEAKPASGDPTPSATTLPDDPAIEREHTYMKVMATVLPWNVVKRGAIFY